MQPRIRDFIETKDGLIFAVVTYYHPKDRYIAFLRYYPSDQGSRVHKNKKYSKVASTQESFIFLKKHYPQYLFFSDVTGSYLQSVPLNMVSKIYFPWIGLKKVSENPATPYEKKIFRLSQIFSEIPENKKGITGSALLGLHTEMSDIDFVIYGLDNFQKARRILRDSIKEGTLSNLSRKHWTKSFKKRFPHKSPLSLAEFIWHEKRKWHKGIIDETIFDILLVRNYKEIHEQYSQKKFRRKYKVTLTCTVVDSSLAFDYPAIFKVECSDPLIKEVYSYTHTYVGQAFEGEKIKVRGYLEEVQGNESYKRIVVGTSREAEDEYIKVIKPVR